MGLQERGNYTSKLMDISIQILTSEQLALKAIKKAGLANMLLGILKILKSYLVKGEFEVDDFFINKIWQNFIYAVMKRSAIEEMFLDSDTLDRLFDILEFVVDNQPRFVYKKTVSTAELREEPVIQTGYFELRAIKDFIEMVVPLFCKNLDQG